MVQSVSMSFLSEGATIAIEKILPTKILSPSVRSSERYRRIQSSMEEVGIVEPPIVFPKQGLSGFYMMLDGHVRLDAAKNLGMKNLFCLISTDDEGFTYNHKVNQLTPIQEHLMIQKAIRDGVSEERIAKTLSFNIATVKKKRDLLEDICPEAVELLRTRRASAGAIREMKRVKPVRQIEMAELMVASGNYTAVYARCMVLATSPDLRVASEEDEGAGNALGAAEQEARDMARLRGEMETLERDFKRVQDEYGQNMLNLVVVVGYLRRLMDSAAAVRFLSKNEPAMLAEFQRIIDIADLRASG